ncbi:hypothetical protein SAMN05421743_101372 [Thalassobacillus cyri]|uniref:Uncharacterized protein n=1 Tax=Thalassobacillus cyri TaxID=571932 RepID=A0A1H3W9L4_9BACI|nr:hypothetical protein [Thalassobacillus cyri]SDZ83777.1 hypothetical protein SAMN05421743_101372 [Thalassobacillus cyri]
MPLEQEVIGMLIAGYSIVMGGALLITLFLWVKKKDNFLAYGSTLLHMVFFSLAFYFVIKAMAFDYHHPMASEEISLQLGIAGVIWAVSMHFLVFAIYHFSKTRK